MRNIFLKTSLERVICYTFSVEPTILQVVFFSTFLIFSLVAFFFFISVFTGAPYVPTPMKKVNLMFKLADIKKGSHVVDLGSGDGRLIIEAAKKGAYAYGVEINPGLVLFSYLNILVNKVSTHAKVIWGTLFSVDYRKYDIIFIAGFIEMMKTLEKEFETKLKKGTKVICYAFPLPNRKPSKVLDGIYLYIY